MSTPENYDDKAERVRTHPQLLPKPQEAGMISAADLQVLSKALGVEGQDHDRRKGSAPPVTPAPPGRRSVLDNEKFGPGNRPHWEMKEGRVSLLDMVYLRGTGMPQSADIHSAQTRHVTREMSTPVLLVHFSLYMYVHLNYR